MTYSPWKEILEHFTTPRRVVLTTHISPDGDALGSELALASWLERQGHHVTILNSDPVPPRYRFLTAPGRFEIWDAGRHQAVVAAADTAVIVDVARRDRLGAVNPALEAAKLFRVVIDHHPNEGPVPADISLVDPTAAATGELLFEMMEAAGRPPDSAAAMALYVAIMTDTGSFRYPNTTSRTHRIVAELLKHPIDTATLFEEVYERTSVKRLALLGAALSHLEVFSGGAVVILSITREMMGRAGAGPEDAEGFVEFIRGIDGCRIAAVFYELEPGKAKVSLRSKGEIDVNLVARRWGGGGHRNAAGIPLQGPFLEFHASVAKALVEAVSPR